MIKLSLTSFYAWLSHQSDLDFVWQSQSQATEGQFNLTFL